MRGDDHKDMKRPGEVRFAFVEKNDFCATPNFELPQLGFFIFFIFFFVFFFNLLKCSYGSINLACLKIPKVVPDAIVKNKKLTQKMVS